MEKLIRKIIITAVVLSVILFISNKIYHFVIDDPYNAPKDGEINFILKDVKLNDGEWKLEFGGSGKRMIWVTDINALYNARNEFYVIEERAAYFTTPNYTIYLHHNGEVKRYIYGEDKEKIHFGSLKQYLDP